MGTLVGQANTTEGFSLTRRDGVDYFSEITIADRQPRGLPLWLDHDPDLVAGTVLYIERHERSGTVIVANVIRPLNGRAHLSIGAGWDQTTSIDVISPLAAQRRADSAVLREISLVDRPGAAVHPVHYSPRDLDAYSGGGGWPHSWPDFAKGVADRAAAHLAKHRRSTGIEVQYVGDDADLLAEARRQRRDEKVIDAIEAARVAEHFDRKYRHLHEVPPELVTTGRRYVRTNVGHVVSVR